MYQTFVKTICEKLKSKKKSQWFELCCIKWNIDKWLTVCNFALFSRKKRVIAQHWLHGRLQFRVGHKKFFNLQYKTLVRWDARTKRLMFQVLFCFHNFLHNPFQTFFQFTYVFIYFFIIKIKSFECPKSIRNNEKK